MIWRLAQGPKIENEALNNVLSSLRPMDENPGQHEQVLFTLFIC